MSDPIEAHLAAVRRAKAARVEAVEPVSDDQPDLFEESAS